MVATLVQKEIVLDGALRYCHARGKDLNEEIVSKIRGFTVTDFDFLAKFRVKPCAANIAMIHYRTANFTASDF